MSASNEQAIPTAPRVIVKTPTADALLDARNLTRNHISVAIPIRSTGPTIHVAISASPFVPTDYLPDWSEHRPTFRSHQVENAAPIQAPENAGMQMHGKVIYDGGRTLRYFICGPIAP
jgi:hypothetical protein